MGNKKGNTDLLRLQQYFDCEIEEEELSEALLEKLDRVKSIYGMLLAMKSRSQIVRLMGRLHGLSQAQAYRDIQDTEFLLGSLSRGSKDIKRLIAENMAQETYKLAKAKNNPIAMASAVKAYNEATGINKEDPDLPDFEKLEGNLIITVVDPLLEAGIQQMLSQGAINLNNFTPPTIDISHEELQESTTRPTDQKTH